MAHPHKHGSMGASPKEPTPEPAWAASDYPEAVREFFAIRDELVDRIGFVNVGWARQVAKETLTRAQEAATMILVSNSGLTLADFGLTSLGGGVAFAVLKGSIDFMTLNPEVQKALQELEDLSNRIERIYLPAMKDLGDRRQIPETVEPLVRNIAGTTYLRPNNDGTTTEVLFVSPDAVGWIIPLDEFKQIAVTKTQLMRGYMSYLWDSIWEWVEFVSTPSRWLPQVTVGVGIVAAAVIAHAVISGRKKK